LIRVINDEWDAEEYPNVLWFAHTTPMPSADEGKTPSAPNPKRTANDALANWVRMAMRQAPSLSIVDMNADDPDHAVDFVFGVKPNPLPVPLP